MGRGASCDGKLYPLSIRQLDGQERSSSEIWLRQVMVGEGGSIRTIMDALEAFVNEKAYTERDLEVNKEQEERKVIAAVGEDAAEVAIGADEESRRSAITAPHVSDLHSIQAQGSDELSSAQSSSAPKRNRWRRAAAECHDVGAMEANTSESAPSQIAVPAQDPRHDKK